MSTYVNLRSCPYCVIKYSEDESQVTGFTQCGVFLSSH